MRNDSSIQGRRLPLWVRDRLRRRHDCVDGDQPKVFINYREREQAGFALLLDRELAEGFGPETVFRASRSIRPGDDFPTAIFSNLRLCSVLLAVIGPHWQTVGAQPERRPLGGVDDWVHREIAWALALGIRVIPVLIAGADLPAEQDLPADIAPLARCQYLRLHDHNIDNDIARVVKEVGDLLSSPRRPARARGDPLQGNPLPTG